MTDTISLGYRVMDGTPVSIPIFHTAITGQTQYSGKTTTIKKMATEASKKGYKVLIFDTKEQEEDYDDFGDAVPVVMRQQLDSFALLGLLESIFKHRLSIYYGTLSRLCERAKDFDDVIRNATKLEATAKSGFLQDAARTLKDLLVRLQSQTENKQTVDELRLPNDINRMVINDFDLQAQQIIVNTALEDVLRKYKKNVIVVIDEAFKFIPEGYSSACRHTLQRVITQGAKSGLYIWIGTQFLATTDKDPLKACAVKIIGTQDHPTEIKHSMALIPGGKKYADIFMKLQKGHFIVTAKEIKEPVIVYVQKIGVPDAVAIQVAKGEIDVNSLIYAPKPKPTKEVAVAAVQTTKNTPPRPYAYGEEQIEEMITMALAKYVTRKELESMGEWMSGRISEMFGKIGVVSKDVEVLRTDMLTTIAQTVKPDMSVVESKVITLIDEQPQIKIIKKIKNITVNGKDLHGVIYTMIAGGMFDQHLTGEGVIKEVHSRGKKAARFAVWKALQEIAAMGFLRIHKGRPAMYKIVDGMKQYIQVSEEVE